MLREGEKVPDFELLDQSGKPVKLADYTGRKLLLYFYPKANTPGCTTQACSVRDASSDLRGKNIAAVGISPDLPKAQTKFDEKYGLAFPLLSDPDHMVAEAYGAWGEKSMYGKKYMGIIRSSFFIDEEGKLVKAWYKVKPADTVPNALETLEG
jgi:peroxiredoxin Q/BCP